MNIMTYLNNAGIIALIVGALYAIFKIKTNVAKQEETKQKIEERNQEIAKKNNEVNATLMTNVIKETTKEGNKLVEKVINVDQKVDEDTKKKEIKIDDTNW